MNNIHNTFLTNRHQNTSGWQKTIASCLTYTDTMTIQWDEQTDILQEDQIIIITIIVLLGFIPFKNV